MTTLVLCGGAHRRGPLGRLHLARSLHRAYFLISMHFVRRQIHAVSPRFGVCLRGLALELPEL